MLPHQRAQRLAKLDARDAAVPRKSIQPSRCSPSAIRLEPVAGENDHGFERTRLLEEMRCARHDLQLLCGREPGKYAPVEVENGRVRATDNEQNRRADPIEGRSGKIRPPAALWRDRQLTPIVIPVPWKIGKTAAAR